MDTEKVVNELRQKYPGKNIIKNPEDDPAEIICEIMPAKGGGAGIAVAIIDESVPHYHKKTAETYRVIKGMLTVFKNGRPFNLQPGDKLAVNPGELHYAIGNETWVEVIANPGWTIEDHFFLG